MKRVVNRLLGIPPIGDEPCLTHIHADKDSGWGGQDDDWGVF